MACNVLWTTCVSIRVCIVYSVMWGLKPVASDLALSSLPLCDLITTPKLSVTVVPPLHSPHHTHLTSLQDNTTTTAAQHRKRTTTTSTTHQYDDNHCKHNYFDRLEEKCFWSLSSNVMAWIYYLSGLSPMNYFISDTFVAAVQPVNRFVCFSKKHLWCFLFSDSSQQRGQARPLTWSAWLGWTALLSPSFTRWLWPMTSDTRHHDPGEVHWGLEHQHQVWQGHSQLPRWWRLHLRAR